MSEEEKKELFTRLDETKKTIQQLRDRLNLIDDQKEEWFTKKDSVTQQIFSSINKARKARAQRNSLTKKVRKAKEERQKLAAELKEKIILLNGIRKEKDELTKKLNIKKDPSVLQEEIEELEYKLETTVMSFEREQKIMKTIKELKKKHKQIKAVSDVWDRGKELTKRIRELKKLAEERHHVVQEAAMRSQEHHNDVLESGKTIDGLKEKEEEAYKKFVEFKQQFNEVNDQLKEQLIVLNQLNQKINSLKQEKRKERKKKIEATLKNKEETVQAKIKRGDKLTTEDLLVLQRTEEPKQA